MTLQSSRIDNEHIHKVLISKKQTIDITFAEISQQTGLNEADVISIFNEPLKSPINKLYLILKALGIDDLVVLLKTFSSCDAK